VANGIEHIFVLMLENRSFDHMLGYSAIHGQDAVTGAPTQIRGLTSLSLLQLAKSFQVGAVSGFAKKKNLGWPLSGSNSLRDFFTANSFAGTTYRASSGADYSMPADPCHEFLCVLTQLCGDGASYPPNGPYPNVTNGGFVTSYAMGGMGDATQSAAAGDPNEIMRCFAPGQLPVLIALAQEFVVCDSWHASMPGPTWPNRLFAHGASSGGLDHSPSDLDILKWVSVDGFQFANGSIFDALGRAGLKWRIYAGDNFPIVAALHGINLTDPRDFGKFASDLMSGGYDAAYTFIEPNYDVFSDYRSGNSQHPLGDATLGEALIKTTYEAIRGSPLWTSSLLIVTWDEHGGFFDHIPPPAATPPGDVASDDDNNTNGFAFDRYGPRVPAVVISPLIPKNLIDHRLYDHASIPATIEACFGIAPLTRRDGTAKNLLPLVSLTNARSDTPATLPPPAISTVDSDRIFVAPIFDGDRSLNSGNLPGFLFVALRLELQASKAESRAGILNQFAGLRTLADAKDYLAHVASLIGT
jgi:phospholipase C